MSKHDTAKLIKDLEAKAKEEAEKKGQGLCGDSDSALCCGSCG